MTDLVKIIDDVFPSYIQDYLEESCFEENFPWSFLNDTAFPAMKGNPAFGHLGIDNFDQFSNVGIFFKIPILMISNAFNLKHENVVRARFGLYLPLANADLHNNPHVDMPEPHSVVLYYLNECDGDTFFFDNDKNIIERVTPKKGRTVLFDGKILHSSSMPSKKARVTLNLNYLK